MAMRCPLSAYAMAMRYSLSTQVLAWSNARYCDRVWWSNAVLITGPVVKCAVLISCMVVKCSGQMRGTEIGWAERGESRRALAPPQDCPGLASFFLLLFSWSLCFYLWRFAGIDGDSAGSFVRDCPGLSSAFFSAESTCIYGDYAGIYGAVAGIYGDGTGDNAESFLLLIAQVCSLSSADRADMYSDDALPFMTMALTILRTLTATMLTNTLTCMVTMPTLMAALLTITGGPQRSSEKLMRSYAADVSRCGLLVTSQIVAGHVTEADGTSQTVGSRCGQWLVTSQRLRSRHRLSGHVTDAVG
eukprot:537280-Rhodomonas_salina.1